MNVLIVGLLPYDSGKTTVAKHLILEAVERGMDVGISKPICAVNGWYRYYCIVRSAKYGKLIGDDVYRLHKVANSSEPIENENPFALLLMPPDPERIEWRSSAYTALSITEQVVLIRITTLSETKHMMVSTNISKLTDTLKNILSDLIDKLDPKPINIDYRDLDNIILNANTIADECLKYITDRHEFNVIESYSDAAMPTRQALTNVDVIVAVAPGKIAIYEGELYKKALIAISSVKEPWLTKTEEVLPLLNPVKTFNTKPFRSVELLDEILRFSKQE